MDDCVRPYPALRPGHVHRSPPWSEVDSWYRVPPKSFSEQPHHYIDILLVLPSLEAPAIAELEKVSFVVLDSARAQALTGKPPPPVSKMLTPLLVRGVYVDGARIPEMWGAFASGTELLISSDNSPGPRVPMRRRPVVVWLKFVPTEVYATTHGAS